MKEIKAILQPFMLEHVLDALDEIDDLPGVTVSQVLGWGRDRAEGVPNPIRQGAHAFAPKTKLEVVVSDRMAECVVDAILRSARTGNPGDGKVFVLRLDNAAKIRTGQRGDAAI